jgi:ABC-type multidrug transport system fused ATPase/permease subunit
MLQVVRPLESLGAAARDLTQAVEFIRPLLDVLRETPEAAATGGRLPQRHGRFPSVDSIDVPHSRAPSISFRGVHFRYDESRPVLRELSFDIAAGRTVAIVGASGSGKSSLVRLLLRLYEPHAGIILLDGIAIDLLHVDDVRAMVGLVPQDTVLFNDTMAFNIGIGQPGADRHDIEHAARQAQLHDFIVSLPAGYDTLVGERGLKLSGGERQRIAIARAVLKQPRIYVFDEATSMLDSITENAILGNLQALSAGCTTITIAHRLSTARHADEIIVLDSGKVAERGDHATLLARGQAYTRLWNAQAHRVSQ